MDAPTNKANAQFDLLRSALRDVFQSLRFDGRCRFCGVGDLDMFTPAAFAHDESCPLVAIDRSATALAEAARISYPMTPVDALLSTLSELELPLQGEDVASVKQHVLDAVADCRAELRGREITAAEACGIAQGVCALRGWPWYEPAQVSETADGYVVQTDAGPTAVQLVIDRWSGTVISSELRRTYRRS